MTRRSKELLARLVMGMSAPADWARRFDEEGFDSYQSAEGAAGQLVAYHASAGVTVRLTMFDAAAIRPDDFPDGWPHVAHETVTLVESEGEGVNGRTMAWVEPRDPEAVWRELRRAFADDGWCEGPPAPPPSARGWVAIREAIALWRHPAHDVYRVLAWYDVQLPDHTVFIGLSEARARSSRPGDEPEPSVD